MYDDLADFTADIKKCMRCGNCQAVCPVYGVTRAEADVARGKLQLGRALLEGRLEPTPRLSALSQRCLLCLACLDACPSGVATCAGIVALRAAARKGGGLPLARRMLLAGLARKPWLDRGLPVARRAQKAAFHPAGGGYRPRFPLGLDVRRIYPALPARTFLAGIRDLVQPPRADLRVAFFAGCMANYVYPGTGEAVVKLLASRRAGVVLPAAQHCCGYPLLALGDPATARAMAASHVAMFHRLGVDFLVTACGTCGEAWREHYPELLRDDQELYDRSLALATKVRDIASLLAELPAPGAMLPLPWRVTYHQACHLGRGMRVGDIPVDLIKAVPGIDFAPLADPGRCCGGAGSFQLFYSELSRAIAAPKLADIRNTGATVLVTGCGACRNQLEGLLAGEGWPGRVMHTAELLALTTP
ncbi:MAG: (Fe-S)-binding protein [Peptococcaceae bacterium]|jgi:glycolate oxidase iron-sulfur subunit|nr:(Fe-S)-binding protein [Peptococcaceae bacterium]